MTRKIPASAVCLLLAGCGGPAVAPAQPAQSAEDASVPVAAGGAREASSAPRGGADLMSVPPRPQIAALEQILVVTPRGSSDRPKILRRLADAYAALEAETRTKNDGHLGPNREAIGQAARRKAIELYTQLAAEHPSFCAGGDGGCGDDVLFRLAAEHEHDQQPAEARKVYRELIKGWPVSRYLPNAYLAFAEVFFEESARDPSKLAVAEKAYLEVLRFPPPDNKVAAYAHYKLGFVHFNKGDTARALDQMTRAIEVAEAGPGLAGVAPLAHEARRDLIPIYAAGGDPARAYDFLAARSGDRPGERERLHRMLEALVQAYVDAGKLEAAAEIYVDWLSRGAGPRTCAAVKGIDGVIARAAGVPGTHAKVQLAASASAPLMKARVECASAP